MSQAPAQLAYAQTPRRWWRRPKRVVPLALLVIVVLGLLAGYRWGRAYWGPYWVQTRYVYRQDRCMRWTAPADFVVYEEDDARAPLLLMQPDYEAVRSLGAPKSAGLAGPPAGHIPAPLSTLSSWTCMCFVHGRYTPAGEKRLGIVGYQVHPAAKGGRKIEIYGSGKTLAGFAPGSRLEGRAASKLNIGLAASDRLRLFAGQPDAGDRSRFTMRYELNGAAGTIEGRLLDEGSFVLKVLDGPAVSKSRRVDEPGLALTPPQAGAR